MARITSWTKYRGYELGSNSLRTDIWQQDDWIDVKFGPESITDAKKQIDEWLEAR